MPLGSIGFERELTESGERMIWLEAAVVDRLRAPARPRRELQRRDPAAGGDRGGADMKRRGQLQTRRHQQPSGSALLSSSLGVLRRLPCPTGERRKPSGRGARPFFQSYSDVILRLVEVEAGGR